MNQTQSCIQGGSTLTFYPPPPSSHSHLFLSFSLPRSCVLVNSLDFLSHFHFLFLSVPLFLSHSWFALMDNVILSLLYCNKETVIYTPHINTGMCNFTISHFHFPSLSLSLPLSLWCFAPTNIIVLACIKETASYSV